MTTAIETDLLDPAAAATYLGIKEGTLACWRSSKRYDLPFIRCGRIIKYRKRDLDRWLSSRTVGATDAQDDR